MTCREKLRLEHPDRIGNQWHGGCNGCPSTYGYLSDDGDFCRRPNCDACWDREIPGTNKKEKKTMPTHTININTKMTKAELVEEIKCAYDHIHAMEDQIKNLERYKQYEDMANELKAMHTAFMNSGFTNEQAYDLLKTMTQAGISTALRGM